MASIQASRDRMLNPLLVGSAVHMLAAATLMAFPNTYDDTMVRERGATIGDVHRAISEMETRADEELTVEDLAEVARVDAGTLSAAFRQHLSTTPGQYLKQVRLDRVHQDLLYADPADNVDEEVVARHGFLNLECFAADHRAAYGCTAAETLRS